MRIKEHPDKTNSVPMEQAAPFLGMVELLTSQLPEKELEKSIEHIMERVHMASIAALITGKIAAVTVKPRIVDGVLDGFEVVTSEEDGAIDAMFDTDPHEAFAKLAQHFITVFKKQHEKPDLDGLLEKLFGAIIDEDDNDDDSEAEAPQEKEAAA